MSSSMFFLWLDVQLLQHHLSNRLLSSWMAFTSLSEVCWAHLCGSVSWLSILFRGSVCLSLYQCRTVLIIVAL